MAAQIGLVMASSAVRFLVAYMLWGHHAQEILTSPILKANSHKTSVELTLDSGVAKVQVTVASTSTAPLREGDKKKLDLPSGLIPTLSPMTRSRVVQFKQNDLEVILPEDFSLTF